MRSVKLSTVLSLIVLVGGMALMGGCNPGMSDQQLANSMQQDRIDALQSEISAMRMERDQLLEQLNAASQTNDVELDALRQKVAALEEDVARKEEMIAMMQEQLVGVSALPVEVSTALEEFAEGSDMVEFDSEHGLVKFKSDLLFERGSDKVTAGAAEAIETLSGILNSAVAQQFDIIVAGHTDDMRIGRAETRAAHPTNRHLSSHRAIAVAEQMETDGIASKRLSTRGFGEYRPVEDNLPNRGGNPANRRVEIYIVPQGG
jgi:chemotaxis protein MotB